MNSEFSPERISTVSKSSIDKFVTRTPEEEKDAKKFFAKKFHEQNLDLWKELKEKEIEKNEEQIKIINLANDETNKVLEKHGCEKFDVDLENIHLFTVEDYERCYGKKLDEIIYFGKFKEKDQGVVIYTRDGKSTNMGFACLAYHELSHFKEHHIVSAVDKDSEAFESTPEKIRREEKNINLMKEIPNASDLYQFIKKDQGENLDCSFYQTGLIVKLGDNDKAEDMEALAKEIPNFRDRREFIREGKMGGKERFVNFDEALIEELTMRFKKGILNNNPYFKEEAELIKEYVERKKDSGEEIDADEIESARKRMAYDINNKEYYEIDVEMHSYKEQREVLNLLVDKLYEGNKDKFNNREEVFDVIAGSAFTGNIVGKNGWGRLIEETFGDEAFKKLAEIDIKLDDVERLKSFVSGLELKH